jgi:hypothetical protein
MQTFLKGIVVKVRSEPDTELSTTRGSRLTGLMNWGSVEIRY